MKPPHITSAASLSVSYCRASPRPNPSRSRGKSPSTSCSLKTNNHGSKHVVNVALGLGTTWRERKDGTRGGALLDPLSPIPSEGFQGPGHLVISRQQSPPQVAYESIPFFRSYCSLRVVLVKQAVSAVTGSFTVLVAVQQPYMVPTGLCLTRLPLDHL